MDKKNKVNYLDIKQKSIDDLNKLSEIIRNKIIDLSQSKSIHLASNLGIVELSISLLYSFNSPDDKIVYDTGHQSYVHKILTDRWDSFETIRDYNGLSGFQDYLESKHDLVSSGHSGSILSFCQGYVESNSKDSKNYCVVVIGDAGISNGLSFEALNNISFNKTRMIIVLNDNEMSISENVGQLHKIMSNIKLSKSFFFSEKILQRTSTFNKFFSKIFEFILKIYSFCENCLISKNFFQNLGLIYIGPVDGHNIKQINKALNKAKWYSNKGPVLVHVKTIKGKGYKTSDIEGIHSSSPLSSNKKDNNQNVSYGDVAANWIYRKAIYDKNIFVFNCGMTLSTGFKRFSKTFKDQYEDLGISEEHAVVKSGGMSFSKSKKIFLIIYSTFLQRAYDEIHHDISRLDLPVIFLIDRADISYGDGDTHHGIYDLAFLKTIPNSIICSPSNDIELNQLLDHAYKNSQFPFFIRYSKNNCPLINKYDVENENNSEIFKFGEWKFVTKNKNSKKLIISYGDVINEIYALIKDNKEIDLLNALYLTNYSPQYVCDILKKYKNVYVIEKVYFQNNLYSDLTKILFENKIFNLNLTSYCIKTNKIGFGNKKIIDKKINFYIPDIIKNILK